MLKMKSLWMIIILFTMCLLKCLAGIGGKNISTDEDALLALKAHITNDPQNLLASNWSKANSTTSVCNWIGITCGIRHRRVRGIALSEMGLTGTVPPDIGNLTFLVYISLHNNSFHGSLPIQFANLRRLKIVDLGYNLFNGVIPSWIGSFTQLQVLHLQSNKFEGVIPTSVYNLSKLHSLFLSRNSLEGQIPEVIGNLYNMEILDLSRNKLTGVIPARVFNISSLQEFYINNNWLSGSIPTTFLLKNNMSSLRILNLPGNNLTGHIPWNMFTHLPNLEGLSLSSNLFTGPIPSTLLACKRLRILSLSYNHLEGDLHKDIGNLTMLQELYLGFSNFEGEIPKSMGNLINLEVLSMTRNTIGGKIPPSIGNLTRLRILHFSENRLTGSIPFEMGNLAYLELLQLGSNNLDGIIPSRIFNMSTLKVLALLENHLSGSLPTSFGLHFPNLEHLYIEQNNFQGPIPISLSNISTLTAIDLSLNMFFGSIPDALGNLRNLERINLGSNRLSGQSFSSGLSLFPSLSNCRSLTIVELSSNPLNLPLEISIGNLSSSLEYFNIADGGLTNSIPEEIGNLSSLIKLDLGHNDLKGHIPLTIGKLKKLQVLDLQSNRIESSIPFELCGIQSLVYVYFGGNMLSEKVPSCLGNLSSLSKLYLQSNRFNFTIPSTLWRLENIMELDLSSNSLSGSLPLDIDNLKTVTRFDLSRNQLSGSIPPSFGDLKSLAYLSLSNNILDGSIPKSFGDVTSMEFLDLSMNNLSGEIPKSLEKLKYLVVFNVSFNQIQGEIPNGGPFTNLTAQSFLGNKALCGAPKFQVHPCKTSNQSGSKKTKIALIVIGITVLALGIVIVILVWYWKRKTKFPNHEGHLPPLATWERISIHELQQATDKFDEANFLGRGAFGSVYKGILSTGMPIAVKVYNLEFEGTFKTFDVECEVLRRIRHRNLVKIITSCSTIELKALVMEFMSNWSLEKWLYSHNYSLDILQRLNIVIDVASALEYLHHGCREPIVHCDLKPANILLDENMVAHVTDFGISKLIGEDQSVIQTVTLATIGYMAPEYGSEGLVSVKGDIYSFGILLMETLTRRKPTDDMFNGEMSMKQWVTNSLPYGVTQIADPNLLIVKELNYLAKTDCISSVMELALMCCADLPEERINSKDVHNALNKIKVKFLKDLQQTN